MELITKSAKETAHFGLKLAKKLRSGTIIALQGDLGGGKTCFTKGFARGLGVQRDIASPSFVLMQVYPIHHGRLRCFCHVDAYRLKRASQVIDIGLGEYLDRQDCVVVVEWADKIKSVLTPYKKTAITFEFLSERQRRITVRQT